MGIIVRHKDFGEGKVKSISNNRIEIEFENQVKKFQFPKAFNSFLETDNAELSKRIAEEGKKSKATKVKKVMTTAPTAHNREIEKNNSARVERILNTHLIGDRAQTIIVNTEKEMFEIIGYMATPGRVSSIEAEVPKDGRDKAFEALFPGQIYRPIEMRDTPSGMPNKLSAQFRINFFNINNCPNALVKNMGKGVGSCVGRINKSKFVLDIVQNYGFCFGDKQDILAIRSIAEKRGFLKSFEKGYRR